MNKTENVSIGRRGFVCDQDAYKILQEYLHRSEQSLKGDPDQKEIIADLESSMAGHLAELGGELVIDRSTAEKVVGLMGEVQAITNHDGPVDADSHDAGRTFRDRLADMVKKPLYKDHERAIGDGICAGIAKQLDIDPVWVRLAFLVLLFITQGFMFLVYILLSIIMKDEPHKKKKTASEVVDDFKERLSSSISGRRPYENLLRKIVVGFVKSVWGLLKILVATTLVLVATSIASVFFMLDSPEVVGILGGSIGWLEYTFIASTGLVLLIPLYELLAAMVRPRPSRSRTTLVLWSVWALSLIIGISSAVNVLPKTYEYIKRENPKNRFIYMQKVGNDVASLCVSPLGTCADSEQILTYEKLCGLDVTVYNKDDRPVWQSRGWNSEFVSVEYPVSEEAYCALVGEILARHGYSSTMFARQSLNDPAYVSNDKIVQDMIQPADRAYWQMEYLVKYY